MAAATTSTPAFDQLRPQEQAGLLPALLAAHPELSETLEALALARVSDVDADEIAGELEGRLSDLSLTEFAARAGKQPGYYVHETDAANEIVAEALVSYEQDLWRAAALDLPDVTRTVLLGIVAGLHRCCEAPDGTVLAYAGPDTPLEATPCRAQAGRAGPSTAHHPSTRPVRIRQQPRTPSAAASPASADGLHQSSATVLRVLGTFAPDRIGTVTLARSEAVVVGILADPEAAPVEVSRLLEATLGDRLEARLDDGRLEIVSRETLMP